MGKYEIPYAATPHRLTQMTNAKLALWLFISSETMLFAALYSAYIMLRTGASQWPRHVLDLKSGTAGLILLLLSALVARFISRGRKGLWLPLVPVLGICFLALRAWECRASWLGGQLPVTHNFFGLYFTLTFVHAVHVLAGVVAFALLGVTGRDEKFYRRVQIATGYWYFITLVEIVLWITLYF